MYIRPESPAGAGVKHSITETWGPEDDKCGPQESVIVSGIKGPPCLWRKNRQAMESWRERREGALKDWWQTNGRPSMQGEAVTQWVGFDRHVSHRPTAPSIAPGWPLWLTASRWCMNRVVRTTVSQSQIATATRPWLNRHSCSRWSPGTHADFWHRRGRGASDHGKITINGSNTVKQMMIGTTIHWWANLVQTHNSTRFI